jgi:peptide/nickel transport system substrate-binding protein
MPDHRQGQDRSPIAALAVTALIISACGSSTATASEAASAAPSPSPSPVASVSPSPGDTTPRGGTVTLPISADVGNWDPGNVSASIPGSQADLLSAVYGSLVWTDTRGVVQPGIAQALTTTDAVNWTLRLRDGVKFIDGHAFDAEAVKYNWDRLADPANGEPAQKYLAKVVTAAVDGATLSIRLPQADADFALRCAEQFPYIASPAALAAAAKKTDIKPIGAGPFELQSWTPGVGAVLTRNTVYWDAPRPYLDGLRFNVVPDALAQMGAVAQGSAQFTPGFPYQFGANATATHVTTLKIDIAGYNVMYFNTRSGLFSDVRARQAVWSGVDLGKLVGAQTTDSTLTAPSTWYPSTSPYYDATLAFPTFDPARAQALFDALTAAGRSLSIHLVAANSADASRATLYLQHALEGYKGVSVAISLVPLVSWSDTCLGQHAFDICLQPGILTLNGPEPSALSLLASTGSQNVSAYSSPAMDADLAATLSAVTDADRKAAHARVQGQFLQDLPLALYGLQNRYLLMRDNTCGVVPGGQGQVQAQFLYIAWFPGEC